MKLIKPIISSCVALFTLSLITSCHDNVWDTYADKKSDKDLLEIISSDENLTTYYSLLLKTGYSKVIETSNGYTVLAPTNDAWIGVDTTNIENLYQQISNTIAYNVFYTDNHKMFDELKSVNGKRIKYDSDTKTFNGAKIIKSNNPASNGVLHITDKVAQHKLNIWEFISTQTDFKQTQYILSQNQKNMDEEKSIAIGVYPDGKMKYDTIWKNINPFLQAYPLDNEDSTYTYILVKNQGYDYLYNKYRHYFRLAKPIQTDSLTQFNVCRDFIFKGSVDISNIDTIINIDDVKVPLNESTVLETIDVSNGKVYVIDQSRIRLKDKIKPIKIEGEDYLASSDRSYVFTRYKRWASGERDIALACSEVQSDTLWRKISLIEDEPPKRDSIASKTYSIHGNVNANVHNFFIEYQADVYSTDYDVYYVAYDDIESHFDHSYTSFGVYKIIQKLFVSMPGQPKLTYGSPRSKSEITNNYLGDKTAFVGIGYAGVHELTKLSQWSLESPSQLVLQALKDEDADIMSVPNFGKMTMWLCNTSRNTASGKQGLLFLDYLLLVPKVYE